MFRVPPAGPVQAYKTYAVRRRPDVDRPAACYEVGCEAFVKGWLTSVDESTEQGLAIGRYIRTESGRTFRESRSAEGLTVFRFEAGQRCFADHRTVAEDYRVRLGDHRGNLGGLRVHTRAVDWVEDFGEHQQLLVEQIEKG
jgi:hypothetical protein